MLFTRPNRIATRLSARVAPQRCPILWADREQIAQDQDPAKWNGQNRLVRRGELARRVHLKETHFLSRQMGTP